jgi:hypothetical protein
MTAVSNLFFGPQVAPAKNTGPLAERFARLIEIAEELALEVGASVAEKRPRIAEVDPARSAAAVQCALQPAKELMACRRQREKLFGKELFSDPAWDILLDLFIAQSERRDVAIGSACIVAAVPFTSGLRWCQLLEKRELVYRTRDPRDGRRIFLRLTDKAFEMVRSALLRNRS